MVIDFSNTSALRTFALLLADKNGVHRRLYVGRLQAATRRHTRRIAGEFALFGRNFALFSRALLRQFSRDARKRVFAGRHFLRGHGGERRTRARVSAACGHFTRLQELLRCVCPDENFTLEHNIRRKLAALRRSPPPTVAFGLADNLAALIYLSSRLLLQNLRRELERITADSESTLLNVEASEMPQVGESL